MVTEDHAKDARRLYNPAFDTLVSGLATDSVNAVNTHIDTLGVMLQLTGIEADGLVRLSGVAGQMKNAARQIAEARDPRIKSALITQLLEVEGEARQEFLHGRFVDYVAPGTPRPEDSLDKHRIDAAYKLVL